MERTVFEIDSKGGWNSVKNYVCGETENFSKDGGNSEEATRDLFYPSLVALKSYWGMNLFPSLIHPDTCYNHLDLLSSQYFWNVIA